MNITSLHPQNEYLSLLLEIPPAQGLSGCYNLRLPNNRSTSTKNYTVHFTCNELPNYQIIKIQYTGFTISKNLNQMNLSCAIVFVLEFTK